MSDGDEAKLVGCHCSEVRVPCSRQALTSAPSSPPAQPQPRDSLEQWLGHLGPLTSLAVDVRQLGFITRDRRLAIFERGKSA